MVEIRWRGIEAYLDEQEYPYEVDEESRLIYVPIGDLDGKPLVAILGIPHESVCFMSAEYPDLTVPEEKEGEIAVILNRFNAKETFACFCISEVDRIIRVVHNMFFYAKEEGGADRIYDSLMYMSISAKEAYPAIKEVLSE